MNGTWIEGLNQIAAGMLFNGGYVRAPVQPAGNDHLADADADRRHAEAGRVSTVTPRIGVLEPLPR